MPVIPVVRGGRIVYESVPWPAECKLQASRKPSDQMTDDEIKREIRLIDEGNEQELHRAFCVNPDCPAKR